MEDRCICCGEIIPEGTMICPQCKSKILANPDLAAPRRDVPLDKIKPNNSNVYRSFRAD